MTLDFIKKVVEVAASDRLQLELFGGKDAQNAYKAFTRGHRLIPFIQSKSFGVALFRLPEDPATYLTGKKFEYARRQRRRALKAGFQFRECMAKDVADEMLNINRSALMRQGRSIPAAYVNKADVARFCERAERIFGVFDETGTMKAYTHAPVLGDVFLFSRLLGHADSLDLGIMYLLLIETTRLRAYEGSANGYPCWAMYDMYLGARSGLWFFKERLGYRPYRVRWRLREET